MDGEDRLEDGRQTAAALRPWIVLVQAGGVVGVFTADEAEAADRTTTRLELTAGRHVDIYEVPARLPPPPALGTAVEPARLGWVYVG